MKITVTGSLGNVSRKLIEKLVASGHQVKVVSSNASRIKDIEQMNAVALVGSVEDLDFLVKAFTGADAVYTMVPPDFNAPDYNAFINKVGENYAKATKQAGIKHVVNLSSVGSPLAGISPLKGYQSMETCFDKFVDINILHLRPGGFYSNFYGSIGLIKHQGIIGNNYPGTANNVLTHPHDIADAAFEALNTLSFTGKNIKYIVSDVRTGKEIAETLGEAIGKPELSWIEFSDEQLLEALMQNGISKDIAQHYMVDAGIATKQGVFDTHFRQNNYPVVGRISLEEFAKEFAHVYSHS